MLVWSEAGEANYRARYPHRRCERKAGQPVYYDGEQVSEYSSIGEAYLERGWVVVNGSSKRRRGTHCISETAKCKRWETIKYWFTQPGIKSTTEIAQKMGFSCADPLRKFCVQYGHDLAAKYGKIIAPPRLKARLANSIWGELIE